MKIIDFKKIDDNDNHIQNLLNSMYFDSDF